MAFSCKGAGTSPPRERTRPEGRAFAGGPGGGSAGRAATPAAAGPFFAPFAEAPASAAPRLPVHLPAPENSSGERGGLRTLRPPPSQGTAKCAPLFRALTQTSSKWIATKPWPIAWSLMEPMIWSGQSGSIGWPYGGFASYSQAVGLCLDHLCTLLQHEAFGPKSLYRSSSKWGGCCCQHGWPKVHAEAPASAASSALKSGTEDPIESGVGGAAELAAAEAPASADAAAALALSKAGACKGWSPMPVAASGVPSGTDGSGWLPAVAGTSGAAGCAPAAEFALLQGLGRPISSAQFGASVKCSW